MYPIYNSWTLDGFQFFALILNPLILSPFWTNAIHLKEWNSTNTRPAVVWNHVESTSVLNFIFSLDFIFRPFVHPSTPSLDPSAPAWLLIDPFFWNKFPCAFVKSIPAASSPLLSSPRPPSYGLTPSFEACCTKDTRRPVGIKGGCPHPEPKGTPSLIGDARYIYAGMCRQIGSLRGKERKLLFFFFFAHFHTVKYSHYG